MSFFLAALLILQAGAGNDISELRQYLGGTYRTTIERLNAKNQILLRNTETLAPEQAAQIRSRMQAPERLPADRPVLSAQLQNVGQGLVSLLFEDDFIIEQVDFVFCPAEILRPERVMTIRIQLDDSRALGPAVTLLQTVYQMPRPIVPGPEYSTTLAYPLARNVPVTIWDVNGMEALYQPVVGKLLVTGQLWLTDKTVVSQCMNIPKLPS